VVGAVKDRSMQVSHRLHCCACVLHATHSNCNVDPATRRNTNEGSSCTLQRELVVQSVNDAPPAQHHLTSNTRSSSSSSAAAAVQNTRHTGCVWDSAAMIEHTRPLQVK